MTEATTQARPAHTPGPWCVNPLHLAQIATNSDEPQLVAAASGFRAALIKRDADNARAANRELRDALAAVLIEVDGPARPYSTDSYLPPHIVAQARRALTLGGLL